MQKERLEIVNISRYQLESIMLDILRKYDRIKTAEFRPEDTLLNKKNACKKLNVSYNTLMSLIEKGAIKTTFDGKRIPLSSIEEYKSMGK